MSKHIVAIIAHPDDEVIGCGGALAKHAVSGDKITLVYMTDGVSARGDSEPAQQARHQMALELGSSLQAEQHFFDFKDNQMDGEPLINIVKAIESLCLSPDIIYTHHQNDLNIDHRITHQAVLTAFRPIPNAPQPSIYSFEINSSTEWSNQTAGNVFAPNTFIDISDHIEAKKQQLALYQTELRLPPHARSVDAIMALARVRGTHVGIEYAEAFMLVREIK